MAQSPWAPTRKRATVSIGRCVADRPMRTSGDSADLLQAFERQREMRAAPRADDGVNLVHDDRPDGPKHLAAAFGRQQQKQRLRRRDEDVRRRAQRSRALGRGRVAGPHGGGDARAVDAEPLGELLDAAPRPARFLWTSALNAFSGET